MHFQAAISSMQNFDIFCPNHGAHSGKTKTSETLQEFFKIQLSKVNLYPEPFPVLSFSECLGVCESAFCLFTPFLSALLVFHWLDKI